MAQIWCVFVFLWCLMVLKLPGDVRLAVLGYILAQPLNL